MKPTQVLVILLCGVLCVAGTLGAATPSAGTDSRFTPARLDGIERSLAMALESNSPGLYTTAALTLQQVKAVAPEYSFDLCVIPLMRIVKNERYESTARIVAAIALHELHSGRGDFAIRRTWEFADDPDVRRTCGWLAYYRSIEH